jgi:hypothetical protein
MSRHTHEHDSAAFDAWIEDAAFLALFVVAVAIATVVIGLMIVF